MIFVLLVIVALRVHILGSYEQTLSVSQAMFSHQGNKILRIDDHLQMSSSGESKLVGELHGRENELVTREWHRKSVKIYIPHPGVRDKVIFRGRAP